MFFFQKIISIDKLFEIEKMILSKKYFVKILFQDKISWRYTS